MCIQNDQGRGKDNISQRLWLITPTETLIILDITKSECNINCFIIH